MCWKKDGVVVSKMSDFYIYPEENQNYVVEYVNRDDADIYVNAVATPSESCTPRWISADGSFDFGGTITQMSDEIVLDIQPNNGFTLVGLYDGDRLITTETVYTFSYGELLTLTDPSHLEVRCERIPSQHTVTLDKTPNVGSVSGAGVYNDGETCRAIATVPTGYVFVGWKNESNSFVSRQPSYTFTVNRDITLTAVYTRYDGNTLELAMVTESEYIEDMVIAVKGVPQPNPATLQKNYDNVTLNAIAQEGYRVSGLYIGSTRISSNGYYMSTFADFARYGSNVRVDVRVEPL